DRYRHRFLSTPDLGSAALHLDDAGESFGDVLRYELDLDDFAVAVMRGGASKCLFHFLSTTYVWPKRVPQGHVVRWRIQRLVDARVTFEYRAEGDVALLNCVGEVACGHSTFSLSCTAFAQGMRSGAIASCLRRRPPTG